MRNIEWSSAVGEVVRSINAVLGFVPVESLVLVELFGDELGGVLRMDLAAAARSGGPGHLAELVAGHGADGVVAVVVSTASDGRDLFRAMVSRVGDALEQRDRQLFGSVQVDRIAEGGRWSCMDECGATGVLGDPSASAMAAAAVVAGRRMYSSRAELAASVAVDFSRVAALAPLLDDVAEVDCVDAAVRSAVDAMRRMSRGEALADADLVRVGRSLVDVRVRDALFNVGDADESAMAESLWTVLARVLPVPFRLEALTLLAFSAFLRGDGSLAVVALEAALADNPSHRMAGMLDSALQSGMAPEQLRGLITNVPPAVSV